MINTFTCVSENMEELIQNQVLWAAPGKLSKVHGERNGTFIPSLISISLKEFNTKDLNVPSHVNLPQQQ